MLASWTQRSQGQKAMLVHFSLPGSGVGSLHLRPGFGGRGRLTQRSQGQKAMLVNCQLPPPTATKNPIPETSRLGLARFTRLTQRSQGQKAMLVNCQLPPPTATNLKPKTQYPKPPGWGWLVSLA